ncbi:MAG: fumarylacetoacetate hydrolase family protein [Chloroflexi bacterium]|nr:fumarylacetoacetate hydrolase family protein [Chloroflexota bacterium]
MRLATVEVDGVARVAAVREGASGPAVGVLEGAGSMRKLANHVGSAGLHTLGAQVSAVTWRPLASVRLLAPVPDPSKIVAIGLNYADHAAEGGVPTPTAPLIFAKFPSTIVGPGDDVTWDRGLTDRVDYEAELGVVIGRRARNVSEADALDHVFGYTCINDVSARDLQFGDGQWIRGKSLDTFCPVGPWIVTADEIPDPQTLRIEAIVNGEALQSSTTANMFFGVRTLIAHCSRAFTLEPGDLIATGTPAGVGVYKKPPRLLRDGDEMIIRIERIGELRNVCRVSGEASPQAE